jgi:SAM-dependent methyltransferase
MQQDPSVHLSDTREAFDGVATDYDGPRGNNALIRDMRREMWHWFDARFAPRSHLLDLGCGTGLDAVRMARLGHRVTATDWSPQMVARTRTRAVRAGLARKVVALNIGSHELQRLDGAARFDGAYSNLGPLNCVPAQAEVARECARLLKPAGTLILSVIGRLCPWELAYYLGQRRWRRAMVRFARGAVPVNLNRRTIWTRYYTPREFYRAYEADFRLVHYRGLCVFVPPPYLSAVRERHRGWYERLWRMDRRAAGWPLLRAMGDHFLIILQKR